MEIENNQECFVMLWRMLERARRLLWEQHKRFCVRNILKLWFGNEANDDAIWEVCRQMTLLLDEEETICGWDELKPPSLYPRKHRELLRTIVALRLGIGVRKVNLKALDKAYSVAFPHSTQINVNKKLKIKNYD